MASIVVTSYAGFDMRDFEFKELFHGMDYQSSSTFFKVTYSNNSADQFTGTGFEYDNKGEPKHGTVETYSHFEAGDVVMSAYNLHIAVSKIDHAANTASTKDDYAVVKAALAGNDTFTGGELNDYFVGYDGKDTLDGKAGSDVLTGGAGADTFIFATGDGHDKITDFTPGKDRINLSDLAGISSFSDLKSHLKASHGDLLIQDHGNVLTLEHTHKSDLHSGDFIF
jgi:Ca2+-binding RTX toxin-like protein